jgi:hypothetical protein
MRSLTIIMILIFCGTAFSATTALERSKPYLPILSSVIRAYWPAAPGKPIMAGKTEQECGWKERATLHTKWANGHDREVGRGMGQITAAYNKDGAERFNNYRNAVRMKALRAWDWQNDPYNVRYQLTYSVLTDRSNFTMVRPYAESDYQAWKMALVCYNAGQGRWLSRRHNAKAKGLPAERWDNGLDQAYSTGETKLLYGRPLYQAVNEYPTIIFKRAEKYKGML